MHACIHTYINTYIHITSDGINGAPHFSTRPSGDEGLKAEVKMPPIRCGNHPPQL